MLEPKVRFKRDDGNSYSQWEEVALGDIATRITRKNSNGETDRPLTIASIEGLVDQRNYFGKTVASKDMTGYFLLKNGEYAYNKSYSAGFDYGSIKRLDKYDMGALSTLYICFALNNDQNSDFYNCYFNGLSWYNQMGEICAEGARNHGLLNVSATDFFKIRLSVPTSAEEQQKIADFLSSVDEVIDLREQEVTNLETQKKAVMKKIFSQEVRFKREDGSDFPEWEEKTTNDVLQTITDYVAAGSFADIAQNVQYQTEGYAQLVRTVDLKNKFTSKEEIFVSESAFNYLWRVNLDKECIVMPNVGNCGEIYYVTPDMLPYDHNVLGPNAIVVRSETVSNRFIAYLMESDSFQEQLKLIVSPSGQTKFNKTEFKRLFLQIPTDEEQRLIANFLSDLDEAISAAKKELDLWKELKKGLLQQMFV